MIHDELADAIVSVLESLPATAGGKTLTAYKWSEGAIRRPSAVVELPTFRRTQPDQREDHVGFDDWRLVYPVVFYVEMGTNPVSAQAQVSASVARFISAIDAFPSPLKSLCSDAKVIESTPFVEPTQTDKVVLIGYETHVSILTFQ